MSHSNCSQLQEMDWRDPGTECERKKMIGKFDSRSKEKDCIKQDSKPKLGFS